MRITFKISILFLVLAFGIISLSCDKDQMIPPTIDFTTGTGYTSAHSNISLDTDFKIGVTAKRTEDKDDLKTFVVTVSYDGGAESTIDNVAIPSAQGGEFTKDYDLTTRNVAGTEEYSFTVANRDGLITTKTIVITVP
jgi:hypothetical protein